jgi:HSP20 family protein
MATAILRHEDWDPRDDLRQLQQEMNRLRRRVMRPSGERRSRVFPSIIISATEEELLVRAEIPGTKLEDLDINVSGDTLTVHGMRRTGEGLEGGWYHRRERQQGGFSRAVRLPAEVDGDRAEASYIAGVLTVSLPLRRPAMPRQIPVKVVEG